ncbi:MAG: hypothetical protein COV76_01675 [Candidatus Omnitrophica bacterium CG11_big_fil_rev_8_21_14_0_20_64_10]|nr:MAG: hypothetical protein COV76_01675 [Candidatus Omnitrophica bacterium CG11_big_fil_rev_8_21_14_0_20_64_10]
MPGTLLNPPPPRDRYPEDGWLKGYFYLNDTDVRGADHKHGKCRKNLDFLRLKDFALHLLNPRPGQQIFDMGCADGAMMIYCGLQGAAVYGADLDPKQVEKANGNLRRFGITGEARCADVRKLDFPDNHFDAAISGDFLEHITDAEKLPAFQEALRVLKPGAPLVIKTPNLAYLELALGFKRLRGLLRFQNPMRYCISQGPGSDDPQHIGLTTKRRLTRTLLSAGFLNYRFYYAPLRRFGDGALMEFLSTEAWGIRNYLSEELFCVAFKPIGLSHFPD